MHTVKKVKTRGCGRLEPRRPGCEVVLRLTHTNESSCAAAIEAADMAKNVPRKATGNAMGRGLESRRKRSQGRILVADAAIFVGWGQIVRGREMKALAVFNESIAYYTRLQQEATIESFEPVLLSAHGGDLAGFV